MTFFGEAVHLDWINVITTGPVDEGGNIYYARDGDTETLSAGDWCVAFYDRNMLSEADTDAEFILVFDVVSGSGTVAVSWGFDPNWNNEPAVCTNTAGTHAITAGINAIPLPGVDAPTYVAGDEELTVHVQVTGSFVVDQLRMRIWPPGGAVGAYSAVVTPTLVETREVTQGPREWSVEYFGSGTFEDDQAITRGMMVDEPLKPVGNFSPPAPGSTRLFNHVGAVFYAWAQVDLTLTGVHALRQQLSFFVGDPEPPGVMGVDWIPPPDETDLWVDIVGEPTVTWRTSTITFVAAPMITGEYSYYNDGPYYLQIDESVTGWSKPTAAGGDFVVFAPGDAREKTDPPPVLGTYDLSSFTPRSGMVLTLFPEGLVAFQPNTQDLGIAFTASSGGTEVIMVLGTMDAPTVATQDAFAFEDLGNYVGLSVDTTRAPFRYWDPNLTPAVVDVVIPLRQLHRDDGLGLTPPRAFGGASRVSTGRAYGYD